MTLKKLLFVTATLFTQSILAQEPAILYSDSAEGETPVAMLDLEKPFTDCRQQISDIIVDDVVYNGASEMIEGVRVDAAKSTNGITLYRISNTNITLGQMRALNLLVVKGAPLIVLSQTCGSGRFTTVRELWSKSVLGK